MTDEQLEAIRERCDKATPGPWIGDRYDGTVKYKITGPDDALVLWVNHKDWEFGFIGENHEEDESFVLHARSDIPALLAEVERLRIDNQRLLENETMALDRMKRAESELVSTKAFVQSLGGEVERLRGEVSGLYSRVGTQVGLIELTEEQLRLSQAEVERLGAEIKSHEAWAKKLIDDPASEPYRKLNTEVERLRAEAKAFWDAYGGLIMSHAEQSPADMALVARMQAVQRIVWEGETQT